MGVVRNYLEALQSRSISFRFLQAKLRDNDIESAQSWPKLLHKHRNDPADPEMLTEWEAALKTIYKNHVYYGDKAVAIFEVGIDEARVLARELSALVASDSPFSAKFPLPLSDEELQAISSTPIPTKVVKRQASGHKRLVFGVKRYIRSREDVDITVYEENVRDAFAGYDQLVGIKCGYVQGMDSVLINTARGQLEVYVDVSSRLTGEDISRSLRHYENYLRDWASSLLKTADPLGKPKNFLPLVRTLYDAPDGCVVSLGHSTATASLKDERMRRKNVDLRSEPFHLGGLANVQNLTDLYSITKTWPKGNGYVCPGVTIPGHFSCIGTDPRSIEYAFITGCEDGNDFDSVMSKLA